MLIQPDFWLNLSSSLLFPSLLFPSLLFSSLLPPNRLVERKQNSLHWKRVWATKKTKKVPRWVYCTSSFHFIWFYFISFHFTLFHFISLYFISFHFISFIFCTLLRLRLCIDFDFDFDFDFDLASLTRTTSLITIFSISLSFCLSVCPCIKTRSHYRTAVVVELVERITNPKQKVSHCSYVISSHFIFF